MNLSKEIDPQLLRNVHIQRLVGTGAYGHVWLVRDRHTGKQLALKKVCEAFRNVTDAKRTYREVSILQQCDHPNIVKLVRVRRASNDFDLYLLMDYSETDLSQLIRRNALNAQQKLNVAYQVIQGLRYLHSRRVVHRDIKPANILVGTHFEIRICDFGLARTLPS